MGLSSRPRKSLTYSHLGELTKGLSRPARKFTDQKLLPDVGSDFLVDGLDVGTSVKKLGDFAIAIG
jgi:hypothetical protein